VHKPALVIGLFVGASVTAGASIASAPFLVNAATYYAHFSSGHQTSEFWKVNLISGDHFVIDGTRNREASYVTARVFPAGTNDKTLRRTRPIEQSDLNHLVAFTPLQSGTYPIEIACNQTNRCAPVEFSVTINHAVDLYVPLSTKIRVSGAFVVNVKAPDGQPITSRTLAVNLYGLWKDNFATPTHHVLGSAGPVRGKAIITYRLPRDLVGKTISLQATTSGAGYLPAASSLCQARVT